MGEEEKVCIGISQSGITISTCLDLMLEESGMDLGLWRGKRRLGWPLETTVEVLEELSLGESQGLLGTTIGT